MAEENTFLTIFCRKMNESLTDLDLFFHSSDLNLRADVADLFAKYTFLRNAHVALMSYCVSENVSLEESPVGETLTRYFEIMNKISPYSPN